MAITNATLVTGATISVSGGITANFTPSGTVVADGVEIVHSEEADYRIRTRISFRAKMPSYNSVTATYSKGKRFVLLTVPKILASGETIFPVIRIEVDDHPEMTAAERLEHRKKAAQVLCGANFELFFSTGSKA